MKLRAFAILLFLALALLSCSKRMEITKDLEYGLHDETELRAFLNRQSTMFENNADQFGHQHAPPEVPAGWTPVFSFVHVSDVQLRDFGILFHGETQSHIADKLAGGTQRVAALDEHDEYPLIALVGAINTMESRPDFLLHTGDSIDAGTVGETIAFITIMNHLDIPWFNAIGNHDVLLFGNFTQSALEVKNQRNEPGVLLTEARSTFMQYHGRHAYNAVSPQRLQVHIPTETFNGDESNSFRHGFDRASHSTPPGDSVAPSPQYSVLIHESPRVRLLVLDTTEPDERIIELGDNEVPGLGARGIVTEKRFKWLRAEIAKAGERGERVIVAGHHPLSHDNGEKRLKGTIEGQRGSYLIDYLRKKQPVIAYLGGHTHRPYIHEHDTPSGTMAEVIAPSLHEHPQIALIITVYAKEDRLALGVGPFKGTSTDDIIAKQLETACDGAKKEAGTNADCWVTGPTVQRFIELR